MESDYCDHVPNPRAVMWFAYTNRFLLDELAFELIAGRWSFEVKDQYDNELAKYEVEWA